MYRDRKQWQREYRRKHPKRGRKASKKYREANRNKEKARYELWKKTKGYARKLLKESGVIAKIPNEILVYKSSILITKRKLKHESIKGTKTQRPIRANR